MKLILTETQFKRIQQKLNEHTENSYNRTIQIIYYYHGTNVKGYEIDSIMDSTITLNYTIEMEARQWGIKNIVLGGLQGPPEIEIDVDYWLDETEMKTATIPLAIDWSVAKTNIETGKGIVSVGDEVEITLINDKEGNLIIQEILIPIYGL